MPPIRWSRSSMSAISRGRALDLCRRVGIVAASRIREGRRQSPISARFRLHAGGPEPQFRSARHRARADRRADPEPRAPRSLRRARRLCRTPPRAYADRGQTVHRRRERFRRKVDRRRNGDPVSWGTLDRRALEAEHVATVCCDQAQALDGPFTTGQIARNSFEQITGSTLVEPATPPRPFHRSRAPGPACPRPAPGRARDLLCRAGARAGRDLVMRPCRADQHDQGRDGGVRGRASCTR